MNNPIGTIAKGYHSYKKISANEWKWDSGIIDNPTMENLLRRGTCKIQNYPEWTILSFKIKELKPYGIITLNKEGRYSLMSWQYSLDFLLANPHNNSIHSVRRERDGEVFTVGDTVNNSQSDYANLQPLAIYDILLNEDGKLLFGIKGCETRQPITFLMHIKPKEWEITAFKSKSDMAYSSRSEIITKNNDTNFENYYLSRLNNYEIHSVKRLSDNELFTIGDKIKIGEFYDIKVIEEFVLLENRMGVRGIGFHIHLKMATKFTPKEWEITSFKFGNQVSAWKDIKKNLKEAGYNNKTEWEAWHIGEQHLISSVKRLSDGVEFKIGDKVKCWDGVREIEIIYIFGGAFKDEIRFAMKGQIGIDKSALYHAATGYTLDHPTKVEKLFTTEDGVDIYEGGSYAVVSLNTWSNYFNKKPEKPATYGTNYKTFSTKEAAEEYILMNKPCLSLKELDDLRHKKGLFGSALIDAAKELVQNKLK